MFVRGGFDVVAWCCGGVASWLCEKLLRGSCCSCFSGGVKLSEEKYDMVQYLPLSIY